MAYPSSESASLDAADDDACFAPDLTWHTVLPPPAPSDWLAGPGEADRDGQTFEQFMLSVGVGSRVRSSRVKRWLPGSDRRKILLVPISGKDDTPEAGWNGAGLGPDINTLADFTSRWFNLPCDVLPDGPEHAVFSVTRTVREGERQWRQLRTEDVHIYLQSVKKAHPEAFALVGITMCDLYTEQMNFVFGEAKQRTGTGIFSFARHQLNFPHVNRSRALKPAAKKKMLVRALKTLVHEIGHLFQIEHCVWFTCNMNGANTLAEVDRQPLRLCPCDLRKVAFAVRYFGGPESFRVRDRYQRLHAFFKHHNISGEAEWTASWLAALKIRSSLSEEPIIHVSDQDAAAASDDDQAHSDSDESIVLLKDNDGSDDLPPPAQRLAAAAPREDRKRKGGQ